MIRRSGDVVNGVGKTSLLWRAWGVLALFLAASGLAGCSFGGEESVTATSTSSAGYVTFTHPVSGFMLTVPDWLAAGRTTRGGAGVIFEADGVSVEAWSAEGTDSSPVPTPETARRAWVGDSGEVTYESDVFEGAFSTSGYTQSGDIFYDRYYVEGSRYRVLRWLYPQSDKDRMDDPVTVSVIEFNPGSWSAPVAQTG